MLYSNKDLKKLIIPLVIEQTLAIAVGMADTIKMCIRDSCRRGSQRHYYGIPGRLRFLFLRKYHQ